MRKYLLLFILLVVFFFIANAPATLIKPYVKNIKNLNISHINGSLWQGDITTNHFEKLSWDINPLYLLLGKISADIAIKFDDHNYLNTSAVMGLFTNPSIDNTSGQLMTTYLQQLVPNTPIMANATLDIQHGRVTWLSLNTALPQKADLTINVNQVNLLGEKIGDYQARLGYINQILKGDIQSTKNASIDTNITFKIDSHHLLTAHGSVKPKTQNLNEIFKELNINTTIRLQQKLTL